MKSTSQPQVYKRRYPKSTSSWQLLDQHFIEFMECYDDQVQSRYGFYRPVVSHVVQKYHGCGDLHQGFAKIKWPDYQHEYLLDFSCRGRWFCPSTDSLGEYVEKKNQRAHPADPPENTEPIEIVPYDDGWLGYDEPVFDF